MRGLLRLNGLDLPVLSYGEVAPELSVQLLGTLHLSCLDAPQQDDPDRSNVHPIAA